MNYDWIRIEDIYRFLLKDGIKQFHPDDPRHTPYWRELKKKCVEGFWNEDFSGMRFMPGRLFFYGTFGTIEDTDTEEKVRRFIRPLVRDIEWERAYMYLEAEGFSGWKNDNDFTSDRDIFDYRKNYDVVKTKRQAKFFKDDGTFKEFIEPRENIRMLHSYDKGAALYANTPKNIMELGSRGGGKSYWYALGGAWYRMVFDAIKYYTEFNIQNPPTAKVLIGSGRSDKSSEFASKIEVAMDALAQLPELGAWKESGEDEFEPSPLYKEMTGTLAPNNKKTPWIHRYSKKINGTWVDGFGTKSCVYHVVYSPQKKDGAEVGAGGRYTDVIYEEVGLTELLIDAYNSNRATTGVGKDKFGVQVFLGTSGNMETIEPARRIFENPESYDVISFPDVYEGSSKKIGFFLRADVTANNFKDENGNTDFESAKIFYDEEEEKAAQSEDPSVLRGQKMNFPRVPTDMWQTEKGHILPSPEAELREKELLRDDLYKQIGYPIKLRWDSNQIRGVDYEVDHTAEPYYIFPLEADLTRKSLSGAIMIYDPPIEIKGEIPNDMYTFTHDPYISDEWDRGGSLGTVHVWLNPKYWDKYMVQSPLVACYIGKPKGGKKEFYSNLEKLMAYYGNQPRSLWYEANAGEYCRGYFHKVKKQNMLCLRPQYERGDKINSSQITQYGFIVGNKLSKIAMLDDLADFLLQEIVVQGQKRRIIETLPCLFTIRQIKYYDLDGNYDAVSSLMAFPLFIREEEHAKIREAFVKNKKKNPLALFSVNKKLIKQPHA